MVTLKVSFQIPYYQKPWDWWITHVFWFLFYFPKKGYIVDKYKLTRSGIDANAKEITFCELSDITPEMRFCDNTFDIDTKRYDIRNNESIVILQDNPYELAYDTPVSRESALKISEARKKLMLDLGWELDVS